GLYQQEQEYHPDGQDGHRQWLSEVSTKNLRDDSFFRKVPQPVSARRYFQQEKKDHHHDGGHIRGQDHALGERDAESSAKHVQQNRHDHGQSAGKRCERGASSRLPIASDRERKSHNQDQRQS